MYACRRDHFIISYIYIYMMYRQQLFSHNVEMYNKGILHFIFTHMLCLQVLPLFEKADSKNKLLRSVAGGGVEQLSTLQGRWDKFELMMESHQLMVKEQV